MMKKTILVTGGAGFIGSSVIRHLINDTDHVVINIDKLTYAGNLDSLKEVADNPRYKFEQVDICDINEIKQLFLEYSPGAVMHLAAESHVDRSIDTPSEFIQTNLVGTYNLLEATKVHWNELNEGEKEDFRFHHVSTDEVYGDLPNDSSLFTEKTPYAPSSPYSASKAGSDHLVRAWGKTYNLPILITNCSNNYGPYQFPEKLIPHMILNAVNGKDLPIYGDGSNIRDWLYVTDHARALCHVLETGKVGETYNIGGNNEYKNIDIVNIICDLLEETVPEKRPENISKYHDLITFVKDRPGHDARYAIDATKIKDELNWEPSETFETGIRKTIKWYLENEEWWKRILSGEYQLERKGL